MSSHRLTFRAHAIQRMFERRIETDNVHAVIETGRVIVQYPDDRPYPSRLVLGFIGGRALHVVAADVPNGNETIIITVYEPDPAQWNEAFDERRDR